MRILVRTSKLAIWARRFALLAAGLLVMSTALRLGSQIDATAYEISLVIGTTTAAIALLLAIAAHVTLWASGDRGWGPATVGLLLGLACLAPAGVSAALVVLYPSTADVSTDVQDPPQLVLAAPNHPDIDPETVLESFPNLITRIYQVSPETLFTLARELVEENGWEELETTMPTQADNRATLNARRRSLFGWENEIVFRVAVSPIGSRIDLRAASLRPVYHDLGDNGRAIESFLRALDEKVDRFIEENPDAIDEDAFETPEDAQPLTNDEGDAQ